MQIPRHLAVIMDGNGRWAEQRGLPRIAGHRQGVEIARSTVQECSRLGVSCLTLFAFSSENWQRPQGEVQALMGLLTSFISAELPTLCQNDIRLRIIGDRSRLSEAVNKVLDHAVSTTAQNKGLVLVLALSYGSRDEQVRAVRDLALRVAAGEIDAGKIDEQAISAALDTAGIPDPDLLVRTSGEMRISNFLLWQLAYTELYFTDVLWPDFDAQQLHRALEEFGRRQRRFGKTGAQLEQDKPL